MEQLELFPDERVTKYEILVTYTVREKCSKVICIETTLDDEDEDDFFDFLDEEIGERLYYDGIDIDYYEWEIIEKESLDG